MPATGSLVVYVNEDGFRRIEHYDPANPPVNQILGFDGSFSADGETCTFNNYLNDITITPAPIYITPVTPP